MIDVAGSAVDLCRVHHYRARAGFNRSVESRKHIFSQIIFRNQGWRTIASIQRKTVAHVMFQAGGDMIRRAWVAPFEAAYEGYPHHFCQVRIFTKSFVEPRPEWLTANIEHR